MERKIDWQRMVKINKAKYTASQVAYGWAGAEMQIPPVNAEKVKKSKMWPTDQPKDSQSGALSRAHTT